jgi:S-adenosylmethionine:tRNA ribosyltransferase-isomerase
VRAEDLDYPLDPASVATRPAEPRDAARLLVLHRRADRIEHRHVRDLPEYLAPGDALVLNTTRVAPMRIRGTRRGDGRTVEGLLLELRDGRRGLALIQGARRFREGDVVELRGTSDALTLVARDGMGWLVESASGEPLMGVVERSGWTPLPPYILEARESAAASQDRVHGADASDRSEDAEDAEDARDRADYQTVYAAMTDRPSCAAPTAGLHFTPDLLTALAGRGVGRIDVELQVGAGTFRTVDAGDVSDHPMHAETCRLTAGATVALSQLSSQQRVVAVGTTSARVLESLSRPLPDTVLRAASLCMDAGRPADIACEFSTDLFIRPGYQFRWVDILMTNFHLPRSTLVALVGALVGMDRLKRVYADAQRTGYRFYSYGDAMLVLP